MRVILRGTTVFVSGLKLQGLEARAEKLVVMAASQGASVEAVAYPRDVTAVTAG